MESAPEVGPASPHSPKSNPFSTPANPDPNLEPEPEPEPEPDAQSTTSSSRPVSAVIPPYWHRHGRNVSGVSLQGLQGITLEDHTADPDSETSRGLWARSVAIDDHVVVRGMTGVGSYVVWNCTIQTLDVSYVAPDFGVGDNSPIY